MGNGSEKTVVLLILVSACSLSLADVVSAMRPLKDYFPHRSFWFPRPATPKQLSTTIPPTVPHLDHITKGKACFCELTRKPICDTKGKEYNNKCEFMCALRENPLLVSQPCKIESKPLSTPNPALVLGVPCGFCPSVYKPVYDKSGKEYKNKCFYKCAKRSMYGPKSATYPMDFHPASDSPTKNGTMHDKPCACTVNSDKPICDQWGNSYQNMCAFICVQLNNPGLRIGSCRHRRVRRNPQSAPHVRPMSRSMGEDEGGQTGSQVKGRTAVKKGKAAGQKGAKGGRAAGQKASKGGRTMVLKGKSAGKGGRGTAGLKGGRKASQKKKGKSVKKANAPSSASGVAQAAP